MNASRILIISGFVYQVQMITCFFVSLAAGNRKVGDGYNEPLRRHLNLEYGSNTVKLAEAWDYHFFYHISS